jgi:hypothetical protein
MPGPAQRAGRNSRHPWRSPVGPACGRSHALLRVQSPPCEPLARRQWPLTLSKLGVRDRTRAVLKAFELQLV